MLNFGPGLVSVALAVDKTGEYATVLQPFALHAVSDFSLDIDDGIQEFEAGGSSIAIHLARKSRKISGSIEGIIPSDLLAQIITGMQEQTRGTVNYKSPDTPITAVTGSGATKVTYTIPDSGVFVEDFGLSLLTAAGDIIPMIRTDEAEPTGYAYKLTVSGQAVGYTVDDVHAGAKFIASVIYSKSGPGISFDITSDTPGATPVFQIMHSGDFQGMRQMTRLNWCVFTKYPVAAGKIGDFSSGKLEFQCMARLGQTAGDVVRTRREA